MALFRRNPTAPDGHPIFEFWAWWAERGADDLAAAIATGEYGTLPETVAAKTAAIHPDLAWELGAGTSAHHRFSLTAGGIAELRPLAERWIRAAPAVTETWEFASSLLRSPDDLDGDVEFAGHRVVLGDSRFAVSIEPDRHRIDVVAYNPAFAMMPEQGQLGLTFLMLDWCLGEDDVERWVGSIEATSIAPTESLTARELAARIDELAAQREENSWAILSWQTDGGDDAMAMVRQWTRWIDYPVLDQHNAITVTFTERTQNGFPGMSSLEQLRALEDELIENFGRHGLLIAHETSAGSRTLHFYSDSHDQNLSESLATWASDRGCLGLEQVADPSWLNVRHFTG